MKTYPDSVRYLYALGNELKTAKLGLERVERLLAELGNPHRGRRFVHVAGTNGKGSVCAMIEAALRAAGIRTGLFTSPHLVEPTERIQIDGEPLSREVFTNAFNRVHEAAERLIQQGELDLHPTYFETVTVMAFLIFREQAVDTVVLEVGLGGRLDATNVVNPVLSVITPIDFDHEGWLGSTIEAIAGEKAGIIKPGVPVVTAAQRPEGMAVIVRKAAEVGAPLIRAGERSVDELELSADGCSFRTGGVSVRCPLRGAHQVGNALTAVAAVEQMKVPVDGIALTVWPGRLERVGERPDVYLDGAHNPAGTRALAAYIRQFPPHRRVWLVYGVMRDKSVAEMVETLFPLAYEIIVTTPPAPRALQPRSIAGIVKHPRLRVIETLAEALSAAQRDAGPGDVIFVTGSLFLVGAARAICLPQKHPVPARPRQSAGT